MLKTAPRRSATAPRRSADARASGGWRLLAEVDFFLDHVVEVRAGGGQHHLDLQLALPGALLAGDALDLTLRGDAHLLEELAQRHVELVFVHGILLTSKIVGWVE